MLQLDHLHLVLFELLLLLLARVWLGTPAVRQALSSPAALTQPGPSDSPIAAEASDPDAEPPSMQASKKPPKLTAAEPSSKLYPQTTINKLLWHFVSLIDPSLLSLLPPTAASPDISICPVSDWNVTFTQDTLVVRQHPEDKAIYASSDYFPAIDLRSLYEMLVNLELRSSWDTLSERTESLERLPNGRGGADYLALRSVFPIKAKDLVLLNIFATLPPTPAGCKRVITAARSVEHPSKPPGTPGYARMDIRISGILLEEHPNGGTVFTQIASVPFLVGALITILCF